MIRVIKNSIRKITLFSQTEYCLLCSSKNKLLVGDVDHAWECWNCNARYWIDDQARLEYMVHHDISSGEADQDLYTKIFTDGQFERKLNFCMIENDD